MRKLSLSMVLPYLLNNVDMHIKAVEITTWIVLLKQLDTCQLLNYTKKNTAKLKEATINCTQQVH